MLKTRFIVLSLLVLSLMLTACGGGTSGLVADDLNPGESFKAVRYTDEGSIDNTLNNTIGLETVTSGDLTTVTISVDDNEPMWGVALDLTYDAGHYTPVSVDFNGLIDTELSFASTKVSGLIGASQVDINGTAVRSGDFATVTFRNEPNRTVSADGDVLPDAVDFIYFPDALTVGAPEYTLDADTLEYSFTSAFAQGDGTRDGFITASDITPIGQYWGEVMIADTDLTPAIGDYNRDGMITVADLSPLGQRYNESVTEFEFWAFDADDTSDTANGVMLGDAIAWGDGVATARGTGAITDWGEVFVVWEGTVDDTAMPEDTDEDGFVYIACRAVNAEDAGDFTATTAVTVGPPPPDGFIITEFVIQIENATNGTDDLFGDGDVATVPANTTVTLNVAEISGTFDGTAFTGDDGTAPTEDYNDALAAFAAAVNWTATNAGDPDMQMTADVLVLSGPSGDGVTGVVFPDNDRGSATPEGLLTADVAMDDPFIPAALSYDIDIDVEMDPVVPRVASIETPLGTNVDGNYLVDPMGATLLTYNLDWGTTVPTDMAEVGVTLYDLTDMTEVLEFTHTTEVEPGINEYVINDHPDPLVAEKQLLANLGGGNMAAEHLYTVRIQVNPFNSVNDPGLYLVRDAYPDEVEMMTIPKPSQVLDDNDHLWIFYPEPKLRQNPRAVYNILDDSIVPEDALAYEDIIKSTGSEFSWENVGALYPKAIVVLDEDGTHDPSEIAVDSTMAVGVNQAYTCPGYIVMDITTLTTEGGPGEDPVHYDFRVFGAGAPLGYGEFTVIKELMDPSDAVGVDFGLNIFDGDLMVDTRDYSDKQLDGTTIGVGATNPDVLFVEFGEGDVGEWDETQSDAINMTMIFSGASGDTEMMWDPRLAINADGTMICVHAFTPLDFVNSGTPGWPGHMEVGENQTLQLVGVGAIVDYTFTDPLVIVGTNPNN